MASRVHIKRASAARAAAIIAVQPRVHRLAALAFQHQRFEQVLVDRSARNAVVNARPQHRLPLALAHAVFDTVELHNVAADGNALMQVRRTVQLFPRNFVHLRQHALAEALIHAAEHRQQEKRLHAGGDRHCDGNALHDDEPEMAVAVAQGFSRLLGVSHQRHRTRGGIFLRIAVLDQCFGVVFDVTGELISQIVRLVSRQAADLREHAVAIFLSVHSLTLFYAKCSTAFTAPEYSRQDASSSVSAARPARVRW